MFTLIVLIVIAICAITLYACVYVGAEAERRERELLEKRKSENLKK